MEDHAQIRPVVAKEQTKMRSSRSPNQQKDFFYNQQYHSQGNFIDFQSEDLNQLEMDEEAMFIDE